ncbi:hypothetical protein GH714_042440 [Hevea brasiliensis]|uniref:Heme O synthase n=1 Tax=Hevea brasiliensis TaxID=3981 RepID=A0A6A6M5N9_HEVBR|nr:hypothetical protein GH714_042440 [Hevea brasiliensis]
MILVMWRNSMSLTPKLLSNLNYYHYGSRSSSIFNANGFVFVPQFLSRCSSSSAAIPPPSGSLRSRFLKRKSDEIQTFSPTSSVAAVDLSPLTSAVQLARHYSRCYWELSKARLSMLVVATSGTGFVLGSGNAVDLAGLCWTCAGTMMVAASANSLNQVFEISNDAKMKRTRQRPLPSGRLTIPHAVTWASSVGLAGTALLTCKANMLAAGLAASNLILYAFVYTPLKQIHPVNTWVGAVVGAIPPLLGWAAASGQVSLNAMILPAALYFWQIPHFMALAYLCRNDYADGGGVTSGWFCLESSILTLAISASAFSFYQDRTVHKAKRMFHASLLYLPIFMSGLLFHRLSGESELPSSLEAKVLDSGTDDQKSEARHTIGSTQARAPVAYASIAPFPFLPAPLYSVP